jgi:hypothetical protein
VSGVARKNFCPKISHNIHLRQPLNIRETHNRPVHITVAISFGFVPPLRVLIDTPSVTVQVHGITGEAMTVGQTIDQDEQKFVEQLNNARYASLSSRAVTVVASDIIDRLMEFMEGREEYRKTRKNKRSTKARLAVRRAMEGIVGDLLRAQQDENSGGWVYRSLKANSFSGEAVSYRNFAVVLDSLGGFVERKAGYQERSHGFDPGGPSLPIRGKASRFRATPDFIQYCSLHGLHVSDIADHFIEDLPRHPLVKKASSMRAPWGTKVRGRTHEIRVRCQGA